MPVERERYIHIFWIRSVRTLIERSRCTFNISAVMSSTGALLFLQILNGFLTSADDGTLVHCISLCARFSFILGSGLLGPL